MCQEYDHGCRLSENDYVIMKSVLIVGELWILNWVGDVLASLHNGAFDKQRSQEAPEIPWLAPNPPELTELTL